MGLIMPERGGRREKGGKRRGRREKRRHAGRKAACDKGREREKEGSEGKRD